MTNKRLDAIRQRLHHKITLEDMNYLMSLVEKQREALSRIADGRFKEHYVDGVYDGTDFVDSKGVVQSVQVIAQQALKCDEGGEVA